MFSAYKINKILISSVALGLLSGCAVFEKKDTDEESNWLVQKFEKDGAVLANQATIAYSNGNFKKAQLLVTDALKDNPRNQKALLVGALNAEQLGRWNRARQYYEDLIVINGEQSSILGSSDGKPQKIVDIARNRLRTIAIKQSELIVENKDGTKSFNISKEAGAEQSKNTIAVALSKRTTPQPKAKPEIGALFTPQEQNMISRFLILKELAEKDLITKEEFLSRRQANSGGLLPLTNTPPASGIDNPAPSPDLIIERIEVLKDAVENRAITPREFSIERNTIIEALLPPTPRTRMAPKAPSKDILGAAKDLRKLEVLYDLNLITSKEKIKEQKAIEKYLGINRAPVAAAAEVPVKSQLEIDAETEAKAPKAPQQIQTVEKIQTIEVVQPAPAAPVQPAFPTQNNTAPQNIVPNVSSPF